MSAGPVSVVGNRRSGTTLLRLMLTAHLRLCVPPESGFVVFHGSYFGDRRFDEGVLKQFLDRLHGPEFNQERGLSCSGGSSAASPTSSTVCTDRTSRSVSLMPIRSGGKTTWNQHHLHELETYFPTAHHAQSPGCRGEEPASAFLSPLATPPVAAEVQTHVPRTAPGDELRPKNADVRRRPAHLASIVNCQRRLAQVPRRSRAASPSQ